MKILLSAVTLIFYSGIFSAQNFTELEYGSYEVGVKILKIEDHTRRSKLHNRPITVQIWYPSHKRTSEKLTTKDYLELKYQEADNRTVPGHLKIAAAHKVRGSMDRWYGHIDEDKWNDLMATKWHASLDLPYLNEAKPWIGIFRLKSLNQFQLIFFAFIQCFLFH
ncbi:hypothetical protein [Portibacter marinus]|uniref:hypothetical protein n=1 Tax=Portibacter marinus TaxID=2898660 RepID=UPI001F41AC14|nr:hypothetical protein [Portibacter marinus]